MSDLRDFSRFLRILALRNGQMLNITSLARNVSVAPNTIKRWISILEASYQIFLLKPYVPNAAKRVIKTPKVYFTDPALAWHIAGGPPRDPGQTLEAFVVAATFRWVAHTDSHRMHYLRTKEGIEVDMILEPRGDRAQSLVAVEIKNTATFTPALLRGLKHLQARHENTQAIVISNIADPPPLGATAFWSVATFFDHLAQTNRTRPATEV